MGNTNFDEVLNALADVDESLEEMEKDAIIERLRGQLQNCVNHLERVKRRMRASDETKINACIEYANRVLYETLKR